MVICKSRSKVFPSLISPSQKAESTSCNKAGLKAESRLTREWTVSLKDLVKGIFIAFSKKSGANNYPPNKNP
jgi:hypothetical protein